MSEGIYSFECRSFKESDPLVFVTCHPSYVEFRQEDIVARFDLEEWKRLWKSLRHPQYGWGTSLDSKHLADYNNRTVLTVGTVLCLAPRGEYEAVIRLKLNPLGYDPEWIDFERIADL